MNLDDLQPNDEVFLDANIFIYHFLGVSADCRHLLARCHQGELKGVTGSFVIAEVIHRLMTAEAVAGGLVTSSQVVKKLRARPDLVRQLTAPAQCLASLQMMKIEIVPLTLTSLAAGVNVQQRFGLLTNDSLLIATLQELGLDKLATNDSDFAHVTGLSLYQPTDV